MASPPGAVMPPRRVGNGGPSAPPVILRRRRVTNSLWWGICGLGLAFLVAPVVWILSGVFQRGISGWRWNVLWTGPAGLGGGLANDILGTLLITFGVAVIAGIVGIGTGIYLSEFCRPSIFSTVLRSASEVLSGIPSIVFGYVGYLALVIGLHWGFSLLSALIVLSMLVVPYIAKSTELALNQVPLAYREGGEALGMVKSYMLRKVVLRSAVPGILTGLVVAIAISIGETAPLLYTAGSITIESLQKILCDHSASGGTGSDFTVCTHGLTGSTLASIVIDIADMTMWVAQGQPCSSEYEKIKFHKQ